MSIKVLLNGFDEFIHELRSATGANGMAESIFNELKGDFLSQIMAATPVDIGTLRRGWTGGKSENAKTFAKSVPTMKFGGTLTSTFTNIAQSIYDSGTYYASFVNYGHSQHVGQYVPKIHARLVNPSVKGLYFVEKVTDEWDATPTLERAANSYIQKVFK